MNFHDNIHPCHVEINGVELRLPRRVVNEGPRHVHRDHGLPHYVEVGVAVARGVGRRDQVVQVDEFFRVCVTAMEVVGLLFVQQLFVQSFSSNPNLT